METLDAAQEEEEDLSCLFASTKMDGVPRGLLLPLVGILAAGVNQRGSPFPT